MTGGARYLVFETGGTKLAAGVAAEDGRLLELQSFRRGEGDRAEQSLGRLIEAGLALRRRRESEGASFRGIGFGFGGAVDRSTRRPWPCLHEPGWEAIDLPAELQRTFDLPAAIENDAKLAALGEAIFGAGRGAETLLYLTLGTGVGGGLVRRGRIVELNDAGEIEIGHVVVEPSGPPCPCGGRGCLEAICSGPGLSRMALEMANREPALWARSPLFQPSREAPPAERCFAAWRAGDAFAAAVIERAAEGLATAVAAAASLLAPNRVVIGGGVGANNPDFLELAQERSRPRVAPYFRNAFTIAPSELGEKAVPQGAGALAAQRFGAMRDSSRLPH